MTTSSKIYLKGLRFHAFHGVLPQERLTGNDYLVDVTIDYDFSKAIETDDVADTISYADIYRLIAQEMSIPAQLLEHVAGRMARRIVEKWPEVGKVDISLTKLNPPMGADCLGAGVNICLINGKNG